MVLYLGHELELHGIIEIFALYSITMEWLLKTLHHTKLDRIFVLYHTLVEVFLLRHEPKTLYYTLSTIINVGVV